MITINTLIAGLILSFLLLALIAFVIGLYNRLVLLKNNVAKAFANIDVLLMQRADEVPNLVAIVKANSEHERTLLKDLTALRSKLLNTEDADKKVTLNNSLSDLWVSAIAVVENYPDFKANQAFLALQKRMTELEDHIADRREFFNESVTLYNTSIQQFPAIILATLFFFRERTLLNHVGNERDT
jgi:LemA protein